MQPGIPTAAQTFPSSQTEIADPTSVDGGAGTSNKGMLLHRREPRNVGREKKSRLEEIVLGVSGNVLQLSNDPLLCQGEGEGEREFSSRECKVENAGITR